MRVLVTRPQTNAQRTAKRLAVMGHEPVLLPLFEPEYFDISAPDTDVISGIAITSAHSIEAMENASAISKLTDIPLFAVGQATAEKARGAGFKDVSAANGGGIELADVIERTLPKDGKLLYFAGEPRSPAFEETLARLDITFETQVCYRMIPCPISPENVSRIFKGGIHAVLLYSRETAARFFDVATTALNAAKDKPDFFCLSHNIAAAVPSKLSGQVRVSAAPTEASLLELL